MLRSAMALVCLLLTCASVAAQRAYPSEPITIINPGPPGGAIDNVQRIIADGLAKQLGATVLTLNLAGAGGILATSRAARARPDGYTLLFHHIGLAVAPSLYEHLPYDTRKDLIPLGLTTEVPLVLVARKSLPPASVEDLVSFVRKEGEKISLATTGPGNVADLCGSLLMERLGAGMTKVAYRGSPPALVDMMGDRIDLMCDQTSTSAEQIKAGTIKAYGVADPGRLSILPDVPTLTEGGFPFSFSIWQGFYAPAGTPAAVVDVLAAALQRALRTEGVRTSLEALGVKVVDASRATPAAHAALLEKELAHWAEVYKDAPKQ